MLNGAGAMLLDCRTCDLSLLCMADQRRFTRRGRTAGFEILLTADNSIRYQQNLSGEPTSISSAASSCRGQPTGLLLLVDSPESSARGASVPRTGYRRPARACCRRKRARPYGRGLCWRRFLGSKVKARSKIRVANPIRNAIRATSTTGEWPESINKTRQQAAAERVTRPLDRNVPFHVPLLHGAFTLHLATPPSQVGPADSELRPDRCDQPAPKSR